MPDNARITGLHHVAFRVRDFDRSVAFYSDVLGFKPKMTWSDPPQRIMMIDIGNDNHLEVFERPDQPAPPAEEGAIIHFAFRTNNTVAMLERARAAGCEVTMEPKHIDVANKLPAGPETVPIRIAFVKGPDGEIVEFFQSDIA